MINLRALIGAALLSASLGLAQVPAHSVTLTWTDTQNPVGTTYNVYRAAGTCPAAAPTTVTPSTAFNLLGNTGGLTSTDTTVAAATTYCYLVSAISIGAQESVGNPLITMVVPANATTSFPPTNLKGTAK